MSGNAPGGGVEDRNIELSGPFVCGGASTLTGKDNHLGCATTWTLTLTRTDDSSVTASVNARMECNGDTCSAGPRTMRR